MLPPGPFGELWLTASELDPPGPTKPPGGLVFSATRSLFGELETLGEPAAAAPEGPCVFVLSAPYAGRMVLPLPSSSDEQLTSSNTSCEPMTKHVRKFKLGETLRGDMVSGNLAERCWSRRAT
jgi:hypothetical protein